MMDPVYIYRAEVLDVHDGDTYRLRVDLGFRCAVTIQCRLHGVDAPELSDRPAGTAARAFAMNLLMPLTDPLSTVVIQSYKDQRSFERWVCDVWLPDGRSLAQVLVDSGHAVAMAR